MGIKIRLNKELYPEAIIREAIRDYGHLATIELETDGSYMTCKFSECQYDEQLTVWEFQNYLIDLFNRSSQD